MKLNSKALDDVILNFKGIPPDKNSFEYQKAFYGQPHPDTMLRAWIHPSLIRPIYRKRCLTWEQLQENIDKRNVAKEIRKHFIVND